MEKRAPEGANEKCSDNIFSTMRGNFISRTKMISFQDFLFSEFHSDITFVAVIYWNGKLDIVKEFYWINYFLKVWNIKFSLIPCNFVRNYGYALKTGWISEENKLQKLEDALNEKC